MKGRVILGLILIGAGVSFFTDIPVFKFVIALLIIWIGVKVLSGEHHHGNSHHHEEKTTGDFLDETLIFSGEKKIISSSENFKGGDITAVFGGGHYDLTHVKTSEKEIKIDVTAIFGGVKLRLPKNWEVKVNSTNILGGVDNKLQSEGEKVIVTIDSTAILGGIELSN